MTYQGVLTKMQTEFLDPIAYYLVFKNQNERVKKANTKLLDYLIDGESIVVKGLDTRPFALFERRQIFAVTNSRIIRLKRKLLDIFKQYE